jgi:hypothetical protein
MLLDAFEKFYFFVTFLEDGIVFKVDFFLLDQNSIFVVSGDRKLGNFNLTRLDVDDGFEVVADFVNSVSSFSLARNLITKILFHLAVFSLQEINVLLNSRDLLGQHLLLLVHINSDASFLLE